MRTSRGRRIRCRLQSRASSLPRKLRSGRRSGVANVPAAASVELAFANVPPGRYAISLFHDENGNGHLDTRMMMPREGYGFSRDAPVRFGPPPFARAAFAVGSERQLQVIRMRYMF